MHMNDAMLACGCRQASRAAGPYQRAGAVRQVRVAAALAQRQQLSVCMLAADAPPYSSSSQCAPCTLPVHTSVCAEQCMPRCPAPVQLWGGWKVPLPHVLPEARARPRQSASVGWWHGLDIRSRRVRHGGRGGVHRCWLHCAVAATALLPALVVIGT